MNYGAFILLYILTALNHHPQDLCLVMVKVVHHRSINVSNVVAVVPLAAEQATLPRVYRGGRTTPPPFELKP